MFVQHYLPLCSELAGEIDHLLNMGAMGESGEVQEEKTEKILKMLSALDKDHQVVPLGSLVI